MSDNINLDKPDLDSNVRTGVLQIILGHIKKAWTRDYRGLIGVPTGAQRIDSSSGSMRIYEKTDSGETLTYDTENDAIIPKTTSEIQSLESRMQAIIESKFDRLKQDILNAESNVQTMIDTKISESKKYIFRYIYPANRIVTYLGVSGYDHTYDKIVIPNGYKSKFLGWERLYERSDYFKEILHSYTISGDYEE